MKRNLLLLLIAVAVCIGCRSSGGGLSGVANWFLPGDSSLDNSRRFWDQTTDNPYR